MKFLHLAPLALSLGFARADVFFGTWSFTVLPGGPSDCPDFDTVDFVFECHLVTGPTAGDEETPCQINPAGTGSTVNYAGGSDDNSCYQILAFSDNACRGTPFFFPPNTCHGGGVGS